MTLFLLKITGKKKIFKYCFNLLFFLSVFQLRVREFSVDSVFQDPCLSYTLRDVICSYCSTCRYIKVKKSVFCVSVSSNEIAMPFLKVADLVILVVLLNVF